MFKKVLRPFTKTKIRKISSAVFTCLVTVIVIFYFAHPVSASTVAQSNDIRAGFGHPQDKIVTATDANKTLLAAYDSTSLVGSETLTGTMFRTSSDHGATWSTPATQIDTNTAGSPYDFSIAIDPTNNNVWVAYDTNGSLAVRLLTYSAGSWSVGSATTLGTKAGCVNGSVNGLVYASPTVAVNSAGKAVVAATENFDPSSTNCPALHTNNQVSWLWNGASWGAKYNALTGLATSNGSGPWPVTAVGAGFWLFIQSTSTNNELYKDTAAAGTWTDASTAVTATGAVNDLTSAGSNQLDVIYDNSGNTAYVHTQCTALSTTPSCSGTTTLDSLPGTDLAGSLTADPASGKLWFIYIVNVSASVFDVDYKNYNGTTWDSSPTTIAASQSMSITAPFGSPSIIGGGIVPVVYALGTASPLTLTFGSISVASNTAPAAPTLSSPTNGQTNRSLSPVFQFKTTDADNDYLRYRLYLYASDCSTPIGSSPFDENSSQTGWSGQDTQGGTAYVGNSSLGSSTTANYTYQASLTPGTTYCWKSDAKDPGGSASFGSASATQLFTTSFSPSAPTLVLPPASASGVADSPLFRLSTTDADGDYVDYKIRLYSTNSDCTSDTISSPNAANLTRDITQLSSQSGWVGKDANTGLAYNASPTLSLSTMANHIFQPAPLASTTTYYWHAAAIDPGGSNAYGPFTSCQSFTTVAHQIQINNGVNIMNGTTILQ